VKKNSNLSSGQRRWFQRDWRLDVIDHIDRRIVWLQEFRKRLVAEYEEKL
jgi:hypothetical protein